MLLVTSLSDIPPLESPCGLTIGTFDGVHLGHQSLLKQLRSRLKAGSGLTVLTFSNHPSQLFTPKTPVPLICPPLQKVKYLFECGVDTVILVPFDHDFAQIPYDDFLRLLKTRLNFNWLMLGEGAAFGKGKKGTPAAVQELSQTLHFEVEYLHKQQPISSRQIRALIQQGALNEAAELLGRPYELIGHPIEKEGRLFCPFPGICLPPEGEYEVTVKHIHSGASLQGIASISEFGIYLSGNHFLAHLNSDICIEFHEK